MISFDNLIVWAKAEAIGRSVSFPHGWIPVEALQDLVLKIQDAEPRPYVPKPYRGDED